MSSLRTRNMKEYRTWLRIISRCHDENDPRYQWYGARGIIVCPEWRRSFLEFLCDMGPAPSKLHTIDRLENTEGYYAENCQWATMKEQGQNRRTNVRLTLGNRTMTMSQWADQLGVDRRVIWKRLAMGWSVVDALTTGLQGRRAAA